MGAHRFSLLVLLLSICCCYALQFPFTIPFFNAKGYVSENFLKTHSKPRIAIIGAGAGGSSAAFWIAKAKERLLIDVEVDVYERESYIGGRCASVHLYDDPSLPAIELGASVFSAENKNLWLASEEFNLTRIMPEHGSELAVWDGESIFLNWSANAGWWSGWSNTIKAIWHYGLHTPKRVNGIAKNISGQFSRLYNLESFKWDDVSNVAASFGWLQLASQTFSSYLQQNGISEKYANELVEAATRLNYGQNVDDIHALQGSFSLDSDGVRIQGGNSQLFEQFLNRSGAKILLNTAVNSIKHKSSSSPYWTVRSNAGSVDYKAVIIAAPFHLSGISIPPTLLEQVPEQPLVSLHVTVLTTTSPSPNPEYFALPASAHVPRRILTTYQGKRRGGNELEFYSLSYQGLVRDGEWAVRILSREPISDDWLDNVFMKQVGWVHRKEWTSLPKPSPTTSFAPVKLDKGLYYASAFEPLISTMEMATIVSRNVVDLLFHQELGSELLSLVRVDN